MAKLFKDKTIRKNLEKFDIPNFEEKLGIVNKWLKAYKNKTLHQKTESQCEQAFNQSFFVELLGYTTFPNAIYTIDPKATAEASGQKPDAALGYYSSELNRTIAVVEVKDVNSALDRSQKREGNLSPVQQAFKYKTQFKDCGFVIASNFYEIRLHKDDQLDYEQFTLESLSDPKDNYFELRKFYYLLCADNFISKSGKTITEELLSEIRVDQEKITKNFYREYKLLRQALIKDIVTNNHVPKSELLLTIEKAQKIIDRIVFVCFCEDKDLLPEDTLLTVVRHAENSFSNHWDILKGFFNAIDSGSEKLGIPHGYDGGLFAEDQRLNNLKISDDVCKKFLEFGKYDFSEDLSVNILGHIFEQSISDIEEIKSKTIEGKETDKKDSKRKKEGIFYTPDYIVDYIVKNSLGKYLEEKETEIKKENRLKEDINDVNYRKRALATYIEYQSVLRNIKVLDPACGSGAFLVKVFDYLLAENIRVANIIADLNDDKTDLFSSENYIKSLLENNIFGVDLNPESVEITKLSLWLKSAQKDKRLVNLNNNIKCGNSLIDDPAVAGERAFKWENEFKEIMENGGFDVVVGNPPYVRQELLTAYKDYFASKYNVYESSADLFSYFYEKSFKLLKNGGFFSFISNTFDKTRAAQKLREHLMTAVKIEKYVDFTDVQIFEGATTYPIIFIAKKQESAGDFSYIKIPKTGGYLPTDFDTLPMLRVAQNSLSSLGWNFHSMNANKILQKLKQHKTIREQFGKCYYGIKTGLNEAFIINRTTKDELKQAHPSSEEIIKPFYEGRDLQKWHSPPLEKYLIFTKRSTEIEKYPAIKAYLERNKERLTPKIDNKQEVGRKPGPYKWFEIQDAVDYYRLFENSKITWPNLQAENKFSIDSDGYYINAPCVIFPSSDKALLAILNSKLVWFFLKSICVVRSGGYIEVKPQYFEQIPIPNYGGISKVLEAKANLIITCSSQFHEKLQKFLVLIQSEFKVEKITKKLEKFYELEFDVFAKELKLNKLSLEKKEELLEFFEKYKKDLNNLKAQLNKTDAEIDEMVFDLYGLNKEERKIVLDN
ncbi:Eco57I restriction-modification methylase domain-containing protein [Patescibacteria group bacterium]|nr:Eco57I restriction-modification methylase domain-containing protein [Patescibacteria group bacterium]MBU1016228.1 Eco57I restriction-modification methylase domain-containing protein [Patescibacteria group bacterium]